MRSWSWQEAEESGCWKHLGGIDEEVYGMVALALALAVAVAVAAAAAGGVVVVVVVVAV